MTQKSDINELKYKFLKLNSINRAYALAILRSLHFAQENSQTETNITQDKDLQNIQKKDI